MGKHLLSTSMKSAVQFQDNHPGCMWGILHILDYHHWHNIRNVFPLKKHHRGRHARYKRINLLNNHGEDQQNGDAEADPLLVRQHGQKWSATGKSSPKSSKKGSCTENMSKEEDSKGWIFSFHGESKLLESSHKFGCKACDTMDNMDYSGQKQANSEALHLDKDGKITEPALDQKLIAAKKLTRDTSIKSKRHPNVLEVFGVEKGLLLEFLQDLDVGGENLHPAFNNKARLTKSGSVPQTSQMRSITPNTFEHKPNEIWPPFHKGGKLLHGTQAQKMFASSFGNDTSYVKPMALESDLGVHSAMKRKQSFSSSNPQGLNHKGWNQMVIYRFKVIKEKIKHALLEFKKSGYQTSVEAIHHRASSQYSITNNEKEVSQSLDGRPIQDYLNNRSSDETKASDYDSSRNEFRPMRRASSLNESLDRYTQLFEQSFIKDIKRNSSMSKSLKLPNEDRNNMSVCPPKASRMNLSLPNLDSFSFFILHEALSDANDMGVTVEADIHVQRKSVSLPLNKDISLDQITKTEIEEIVDSGGKDVKSTPLSDKTMEKNDEEMNCNNRKDTHEPALEDGSFPKEQVETSMPTYPSNEAMATLETSCENNNTSHAEGRELNARGSRVDELESDLPNGGSIYSCLGSLHNTNATAKGTQSKSDTDIDSNFKYVIDVLEFLGFMGNEDIQMLQTVDQPLNPSLFMDLDGFGSHETESSGEGSVNTYHHLLLCNVVKEVLLQIHETSPAYFPRPFSFNNCLHPIHKGHHLLDEVWTRVNSYLCLRPELDQTLDDVVRRDLAKNSGWMNLQREEECVALALEEMIVKDLLDEVIFS